MPMNRVTNTMITRRYMSNLNQSLGDLSKSMGKISSGKEYSRLSESPLDVARAMRIEESLYQNSQYTKTLNDVSTELASAESNLMDVIDILSTAYERSIKAGTGTTSESDREVIAGEIQSYIDAIIQNMNATFNDKFLFSNTNNGDNAPFELAEDGKTVLFNGCNIDDVFKGDDGNYYVYVTDDDGNKLLELGTDQVTDADGNLAFTYSATGDTVYRNAEYAGNSDVIDNGDGTYDIIQRDANGNQLFDDTSGTGTGTVYLSEEDGFYYNSDGTAYSGDPDTDLTQQIQSIDMYFTVDADGNEVGFTGSEADLTKKYEMVPQTVLVSESATRYIDAGFGMSFNSDGSLIAASVLEVSYGGLDCLGFGLDENGLPNNVLSILVDLRDACYTEGEDFDLDHFGVVADKLIEVKDTTNFYISNIGTRSNFIQKAITRLEDEEYNLESLKSILIEVDSAEEIIAYKQYEFAWNAILQMGNKIIPTSLMDFI